MIEFVADCIHFGLASEAPTPMTESDYIGMVVEALSSCKHVSDVESFTTRLFVNREFELNHPVPRLAEMRGVVPMVWSFGFRFSLAIPKEGQLALGVDPAVVPLGRLGVDIKPTLFGYPVAFIEVAESAPGADVSEAAYMIREHLARELPQHTDEIRCESVGRFPDNVRCRLSLDLAPFKDSPQSRFVWRYTNERGCDFLDIYANPRHFDSERIAYEAFKNDERAELGFYFGMIQGQDADHHEWLQLERMFSLANSIVQGRGPRAWLSRVFRLSGLVDRTAAASAYFQVEHIKNEHGLNVMHSYLMSTYPRGCAFEALIKKQQATSLAFPIDEVQRFVQFTESKRQHGVAIFMNVMAAAIGAAVGFGLSLLLFDP